MSWRGTGIALLIALCAGCSSKAAEESKLPTDDVVRAPEVHVAVELLDLPVEETPAQDTKLDSDPNREEEDKDAEADKRGLSRMLELFRARGRDGGDRPSAPPPPPDEGVDPLPEKSFKAIRQATGESVGGRVEPANIQDAVAKGRERFSRCLSTDSKLVMEATISSSGDVVDAHSTSSQPDDPKLRDCVVAVFKHLKLQPLATPQLARVKFALALKRSGDY